MTKLKEGIKNPQSVTELLITEEDLIKGLPREISLMVNLKKLDISGSENGSLSFPKFFYDLPIEDIEIGHFRAHDVFAFKDLKKLRLASHFMQDDILPICRNLTGLKYLEIWGYHPKRSLILPPEIKNLQDLEELELVTCNMTGLPDEMYLLKQLKKIRLRNHAFTEFPPVLARISGLEFLVLSSCPLIIDLPVEMENMKKLKHLDLSWNFKGKISKSFDEELDDIFDDNLIKSVNVPMVIGKLENLEELIIDHCDIKNITAIKSLKKLKKLSLSSSKLNNISDIAEIETLEELNIEYSYNIKDLTPLIKLGSLKKLNLHGTYIKDISILSEIKSLEELNIEGCSSIADLSPIMNHQNIKNLIADDSIIKNWEKREDLKTMGNPEDIKRLINSTSIEDVEEGLKQFAEYVSLTSSRDTNTTFQFFNLNKQDYDETELVEIEELESMLVTFREKISSESLVKIISTSLQNIYDNFQVTLDAIGILIERKDIKGQNEIVEIFKNACEYYDAGHRFMENTVHDQLLDDLFAEFEGEPLVNLLTWCSDDFLLNDMGLDGMDNLFLPAFEKIKNTPLEDELLDFFINYINDCDSEYVVEYGILDGFENTSMKVQDAIKKLKEKIFKKTKSIPEKRRFEFIDGNSSKFWEIEIAEDSYTVIYGRIGNAGKQQIKEFDSEEQCMKEAEKAINEKLKKGYNETTVNDTKTPQTVKKTDPIKKTLSDYFIEAYEQNDPDAMIELLPRLAEIDNKNKRDEIVSCYLYNTFNNCLREKKYSLAEKIIETYVGLIPQIGHTSIIVPGAVTSTMSNSRENFASDTIVLYIFTKNEKILKLAEMLIPENITSAVLAYNLSCLYAVSKKKENMLKYIKTSLDLGKKKEQFFSDSDFIFYYNDRDFLDLLEK